MMTLAQTRNSVPNHNYSESPIASFRAAKQTGKVVLAFSKGA
jgi:hypothetical protein